MTVAPHLRWPAVAAPLVRAAPEAVALPPTARLICVVLAVLDVDRTREFGADDERMLASLCAQAAFSLVKAQQLTKLVEDVSRSDAARHHNHATRSDGGALSGNDSSSNSRGGGRGGSRGAASSSQGGAGSLADDNIDSFQFRMSEIEFGDKIGSGGSVSSAG